MNIVSKKYLLILIFFGLNGCHSDENTSDKIYDKVNMHYNYEENSVISFDNELVDYFEIDEYNNFYIVKNQNVRVYKYLSDGSLYGVVGRTGRGPNEFEDGSIVNIVLQDSTLISYSLNGTRIKKYDLNLNYLSETTHSNVLLDVEILNESRFITSSVSAGSNFNLILKIIDANSGDTIHHLDILQHPNKFYSTLFEILIVNTSQFSVSFLAINKTLIFNSNGKLVNEFSLDNIETQSQEKEYFGRTIPESLLFRDVTYDEKRNFLIYLEGGAKDFSGSNLIQIYSLLGEYKKTVKLPSKVEQITMQNGTLYGLKRDDRESSVVSFGKIEW
jgi:hypothetical protein